MLVGMRDSKVWHAWVAHDEDQAMCSVLQLTCCVDGAAACDATPPPH